MIYIVAVHGETLAISVNPTAVARKIGEDLSLRRLLADEVGITGKHYWMAAEQIVYLEDDHALHIAALIVNALRDDEALANLQGRKFNFAVAFDESIYVLAVSITGEGAVVESEELLSADDGLRHIKENPKNTLYLNAGALTLKLKGEGCKESPAEINFLSPNRDFLFKKAWTANRILPLSFVAVACVAALYLTVSFIVSLIPEPQEIVPDRSPRLINDLSAVMRNIANTQDGYAPLLLYGLNSVEHRVSGVHIFIDATGNQTPSLPVFNRLTELSGLLHGHLVVTQVGWKIGGMPSVAKGVAVPPKPLSSIDKKMGNILKLNDNNLYEMRSTLKLGERFERSYLSGDYIEYRSELEIKHPTKTYLLAVADLIEEQKIEANYLDHQYTIKDQRFNTINIKFLLRGY